MNGSGVQSEVRRIEVQPEPSLSRSDHDYADAFEIRVSEPDDRSAEAWARAALEHAPGWMRGVILLAHRGVLGFRPVAGPPEVQILGWQILTRERDAIVLEAQGPLLQAVLVARRVGPDAARVQTFLWHRQAVARWLWVAVGPLHRIFVPRLLRHAAAFPSVVAASEAGASQWAQ